jgi:uncharacterized protein (DUF1501 family)
MMKRRDFVRRAIPVATLPALLGGLTFRAYGGGNPVIDALIGTRDYPDHVLVLIQLNGGNDGLNTVIPRDQYPALMNARANIAIPDNKLIVVNDQVGLHPSLAEFAQVYADGKAAIIQSVSYPNPNFSHFQATDIWLTAADSSQSLTSGWLGRYLDREYPGFPTGYPNSSSPDPVALQIGSVVSPALQGPSVSMGMAITSPTSFYQLVSGGIDTAPNTPAGHELTFLREVALETEQYASVIKNAAGKAKNLSTLYPAAGQNSLADQLKIVAQLVAGGLKTKIYVVNLGGFDTHSAQVDATAGTDAGAHANLLHKLSVAIAAFQDDLRLLGAEERVIGMTFSEFGRRIKSNASLGTDHGTAAPMFIFGKRVVGGVVGTNPLLPLNAAVGDNLAMQFDFRSIYASILVRWFRAPEPELQTALQRDFPVLPVIQNAYSPKTPVVWSNVRPETAGLEQNYPNPFNPTTTIRFFSAGTPVEITVYNALGQKVETLADGTYPPGGYEAVFDGSAHPSGIYFCRLRSESGSQVLRMVLAK